MAKYIVQLRRGTAEQWSQHSTIRPLEGELVLELDKENYQHKLKIGDGIHTYAELAYLKAGDDIVTQALPRIVTVNLELDDWQRTTYATNPDIIYYSQTLSLDGITEYSRLDLQPDADMLAEFALLNIVFVTENHNKTITVYSVGDKPLKSYEMQATIVETEVASTQNKIVGAPVVTPILKPDWNQTDSTKSDYINNKPITNISDSFKIEYGIEPGCYLLRQNTKVMYYTEGDMTLDPDTMMPTVNFEWKEIDYKINSDTLACVGTTVIDEDEKITIPITLFGNIQKNNDETSFESVLKCYITGAYPGSSGFETGYEVSYEVGESGFTPHITFQYDEDTGDLFYTSDGLFIEKDYILDKDIILKEDLDNGLRRKMGIWSSGTYYKEGEWVQGIVRDDDGYLVIAAMLCIKSHTSPFVDYADDAEDFHDCWGRVLFDASGAIRDAENNIIHETYVQKKDGFGLAMLYDEVSLKQTHTYIGISDGNFAMIPAYTSDLTNDSGYVKQSDVDASIQQAILDSWEAEV